MVVASTAPSGPSADAELVSVDLARRRRQAGEAGCEGAARHRRLPAVSDRTAAAMKTRHVEVGHRELQPETLRNGAEGKGPSIYLQDPEGNGVELKGPAIVGEL